MGGSVQGWAGYTGNGRDRSEDFLMDEQLMAPGVDGDSLNRGHRRVGGGDGMGLQVVQTPDIAGGNIGGNTAHHFRVKANTTEGAKEIALDRLGPTEVMVSDQLKF